MYKHLLLAMVLLPLLSINTVASSEQEIDLNWLSGTELAFQVPNESSTQYEIPPLDMGKVFLEVTSGMGFGIVGSLAGGYIGLKLGEQNGADGWSSLAGIITGVLLGYNVGSPLGVYLVGNTDGETGSLLATYLGGLVGSITFVSLAEPLNLTKSETFFGISMLLASPVGATIGFNMTRRYEDSYSLINLEDREISFKLPTLQTTYSQKNKSFVSYANLFQVNF